MVIASSEIPIIEEWISLICLCLPYCYLVVWVISNLAPVLCILKVYVDAVLLSTLHFSVLNFCSSLLILLWRSFMTLFISCHLFTVPPLLYVPFLLSHRHCSLPVLVGNLFESNNLPLLVFYSFFPISEDLYSFFYLSGLSWPPIAYCLCQFSLCPFCCVI